MNNLELFKLLLLITYTLTTSNVQVKQKDNSNCIQTLSDGQRIDLSPLKSHKDFDKDTTTNGRTFFHQYFAICKNISNPCQNIQSSTAEFIKTSTGVEGCRVLGKKEEMIVEPLFMKDVKDSNPGRMLFSSKGVDEVVGISIQQADGDDCTFSKKRNVFVYAMCDENTEGDFAEVEGKGTCTQKQYLRTKYACGGVSQFSSFFEQLTQLVILVVAYFGIMIYLNKKKGLKGTKAIPHQEFLKTLPKKLNGAAQHLKTLLNKINFGKKGGKKARYNKL